MFEDAFEHSTWQQMPQQLTVAEISCKQKNNLCIQKLEEQALDCLGKVFEDIGKKTGPDHFITEINPRDGKEQVMIPIDLQN